MEKNDNKYDFLELLTIAAELSDEGYVLVDAVHPYYFDEKFDYEKYRNYLSELEIKRQESLLAGEELDPVVNLFQEHLDFQFEENNMAKIIFKDIIVKKNQDDSYELTDAQIEGLSGLGIYNNGYYEAYNETKLVDVVKTKNELHDLIIDLYIKEKNVSKTL